MAGELFSELVEAAHCKMSVTVKKLMKECTKSGGKWRDMR